MIPVLKDIFRYLLVVLLVAVACQCGEPETDLKTVAGVNLERYLGKWYQVAFYPNSFQDADCAVTTAVYSLREDKDIKVVNTCYDDKAMKQVRDEAEGKAWVVDEKTNAKLKVRFFWPFSGNYQCNVCIINFDTGHFADIAQVGRL